MPHQQSVNWLIGRRIKLTPKKIIPRPSEQGFGFQTLFTRLRPQNEEKRSAEAKKYANTWSNRVYFIDRSPDNIVDPKWNYYLYELQIVEYDGAFDPGDYILKIFTNDIQVIAEGRFTIQ